MQAGFTPLDWGEVLGIAFTDKPVNACRALALFHAFAQRIRLAETPQAALSFPVALPNATPPHQILLTLIASTLAGVRLFIKCRCAASLGRLPGSSGGAGAGLADLRRGGEGAWPLSLRRGGPQAPVPLTRHPKALTV